MIFQTAKRYFLKYVEWVLHILFWGLYFKGVNAQFSVNWLDQKAHLWGISPISAILFPVFFYLNAFWLIPKFLRGRKRYRYFLATFGILIVVELIRACIFVWSSGVDLPFQELFPSQLVGRYSFFIGGPNSLFFAIFLSFAYKFIRDWMKHDRQIEQLEKEKMAMELNLLKSQMSPHFLFNNLNALDDLIDLDTDLAKKYLHKLSGIYRYSIVNMEQDVVSLEEEWQAIDNYIFLLEERFGEAYKFEKLNKLGNLQEILIPQAHCKLWWRMR
jgi:two-component system LytT family sensor kinase